MGEVVLYVNCDPDTVACIALDAVGSLFPVNDLVKGAWPGVVHGGVRVTSFCFLGHWLSFSLSVCVNIFFSFGTS